MAKIDSTRLLTIGFAIVIILLITLTSIASLRLAEVDRKREHLVQHDTVKFEIFQSMRKIVRERTLIIFTMSHDDDPFKVDNEFMHFNSLARDFISLRLRMNDIPLYPDENQLFEKARQIIRVTAPLQDEIIQSIIDGDTGKKNILIKRDIPLEKEVWKIFDDIVQSSQVHLSREAAENEHANRRATISIMVLGVLAVSIAFIIMLRVTRYTKEYQQALRREKEFAEITLSSIGDAVIAVNSQGLITFINLAAQKMLSCTSQQALGKPLEKIYAVKTESAHDQEKPIAFESFMDGPAVSISRYNVLKMQDGTECIVEDVIAPMHDTRGEFLGSTIIFRDVTQARLAEQQLSWQALHDPLTGLANRLQFETKLNEMRAHAKRSNTEHVLLIIDLDNFKPVNDTCGHVAGDMLLKKITEALTRKMRKSDMLARLGGDEFAILLDGCSIPEAKSIAETLRSEIQNLVFDWQGNTFSISASIGISAITSFSESNESIVTKADAACYAAKNAGRNRVCVVD